jgi:hypothetical protein
MIGNVPTSYRLPALYGNANVGKNVLRTNRSPEKKRLWEKLLRYLITAGKTFPETMPLHEKTSLGKSARF